MGSRSEQLTVYVTAERKAELEQRAADAGDSVSGVINDMIDQQLQQEAQDAIASEARAEERLQELIQVGTEEMTEVAREIRDMNAKFGAYAIANFELMKHDRSDHVRQHALSTGARRIRQDLDVVTEDLAPDDAVVGDDAPAAAEGEPAEESGGGDVEETAATSAQDASMSTAAAMTGGDRNGPENTQDESDACADTETDTDDETSTAGDADSDSEGGLFDRLRSDQS